MKTLTRIVAVIMFVMMTGLVFAACGSVRNDILGEWTTSRINGRILEDYAADSGVPSNQVALNLRLEADKAVITGVKGSQAYHVSYSSDGVELKLNGNNAGFITYDKAAQTLTMNDSSTGSIIVYVFSKGTTELPSEPADTEPTAEPEGTGESQGTQDFTGRDYGELDEDELEGNTGATETEGTDGYTGRDYGELDEDEL